MTQNIIEDLGKSWDIAWPLLCQIGLAGVVMFACVIVSDYYAWKESERKEGRE